jgi:hypothetical protein
MPISTMMHMPRANAQQGLPQTHEPITVYIKHKQAFLKPKSPKFYLCFNGIRFRAGNLLCMQQL